MKNDKKFSQQTLASGRGSLFVCIENVKNVDISLAGQFHIDVTLCLVNILLRVKLYWKTLKAFGLFPRKNNHESFFDVT